MSLADAASPTSVQRLMSIAQPFSLSSQAPHPHPLLSSLRRRKDPALVLPPQHPPRHLPSRDLQHLWVTRDYPKDHPLAYVVATPAGGNPIEERVICNHGFGTNLGYSTRVAYGRYKEQYSVPVRPVLSGLSQSNLFPRTFVSDLFSRPVQQTSPLFSGVPISFTLVHPISRPVRLLVRCIFFESFPQRLLPGPSPFFSTFTTPIAPEPVRTSKPAVSASHHSPRLQPECFTNLSIPNLLILG